jgi:hypothetical protein
MSTNYYLRKRASQQQLDELIELINNARNDMSQYRNISEKAMELNNDIHLGKRSCGWKFLWNTNMTFDHSHKVIGKLYDLTQDSLFSLIRNPEYEVFDEYNELQDKDEFIKMALEWGEDDGYDGVLNSPEESSRWSLRQEQLPYQKLGYEFKKDTQACFISDGLRFSIFDNFC